MDMDKEPLIGAVEALIFVSGDPVPIKRLAEVLDAPDEAIHEAIEALNQRYLDTGSGLQALEVAGGFQLRTRPVHSQAVNRFLERKRKTSLSGPALETLAIIAYKQPITRAEIEAIRGVMVDGVLKSILDKRLIKVAGVKEVPGRPNLYRTTKHFLEYFGITSLKELPPIADIEKTFSSRSGAEEEDAGPEEATEEAPTGDLLPDTEVPPGPPNNFSPEDGISPEESESPEISESPEESKSPEEGISTEEGESPEENDPATESSPKPHPAE